MEREPLLYFGRRSDKQVKRKGIINPPVNIYGLFDILSLTVVHDHKQIHIAILSGFAIGTGTEKDHTFRIEFLSQLPHIRFDF